MQGERRRSGGHGDARVWPMEPSPGADPRTPLAWQHRNINYQQYQQQQQHAMKQQGSYLERLTSPGHEKQQQKQHPLQHQGGQGVAYIIEDQAQGRRPSSPSTATSATSSSSSASRSQKNDYNNMAAVPMYAPMPGVIPPTTWDGEPCPVHHLSAINAIMAPPPPPPQAMILSPMTTMSRRGTPSYPPSLPAPPPPPDKGMMLLLPPMMRPRPLVLPAENANHLEPLPVRDPKSSSAMTSMESITKELDINTCEGHTVVLWFIIIVITIGVILAAVLRFVMG